MAITLDGSNGILSPDFEPSSSTTPTNGLFLPAANTVGLATGSTERLRIDSSGNLGLGITPSAWYSGYKAIQVNGLALSCFNYSDAVLFKNTVFSPSAPYNTRIASGYAQRYAMDGNGNHVWEVAGTGAAGSTISFTQAMTLDASGNLLVGTTSTNSFTSATIFSSKGLAVAWNDAQYIGMPYNAGTGYYNGLYLNAGTRETNIRAIADDGASKITFSTGITAVERARIDGSGNLLVGTTSAGDGKVRIYASANAYNLLKIDDTGTTGGNYVQFLNSSGTQAGAINHNGTTTVSYTSASDQRLKENIVDAPSAIDSINAIKVRSFDWKADGSHVDYGYIAQELLEVAPEAVTAPEDPEEMMGVDFGKLTPRIIKAIQELTARLETLENK